VEEVKRALLGSSRADFDKFTRAYERSRLYERGGERRKERVHKILEKKKADRELVLNVLDGVDEWENRPARADGSELALLVRIKRNSSTMLGAINQRESKVTES
jgi:hypothetical protein